MAWLSITVEVAPAQAEALSEALIEAGADSVDVDVDLRPGTSLTRVTALAARDADPGQLVASAARGAGMASPEFRSGQVDDEDWVRRSQAQFGPARIGRRLWIVPSWHTPPAPPAIVVRLDPGLAFGTGSHPSTRLVLARIEATLAGGERVLDYGCGSGILAIAAGKLGAGELHGVDIDPQAIEVAGENARMNGVAFKASLPDELAAGAYDLVLANILAGPLISLAPELAARTRTHGRVLLAGILDSQAAQVAAAYAPHFFTEVVGREAEWALLEGTRR